MNKIAPQDMRKHLMLNQSRLSTAEEVAQEIDWDATEEFSRDDKNQAWIHCSSWYRPAKGGKPNGVPYNFVKGSGTLGKGKCIKDSDFNPSVVNRENSVDTAIGVGESASKNLSVGLHKST